jgi:hypothetical protein
MSKGRKDRPMNTYRALQRLWEPPAETLGNLAGILRAHWQAARVPERLFWSSSVNWLECRPIESRQARIAASSYQLTSGGRLIK